MLLYVTFELHDVIWKLIHKSLSENWKDCSNKEISFAFGVISVH